VGQVLADAAGVVAVEMVAQLRLVGEPQLALGALMHAHALSVTPGGHAAKVAPAASGREGGRVIVRLAVDVDADAVRAVHLAAFDRPALGGAPAPEARLVDDLRTGGDLVAALSFVAVGGAGAGGVTGAVADPAAGAATGAVGAVAGGAAGAVVVGSVVTSAADLGGRRVVAVGPLGVVPSWHGRGAGSTLMHAVLGAADALGEPCVVLLGDPAFYGRFGFEPAARYGVAAPDPAWGEHLMLRRLTVWRPGLVGRFRYPPAFDGV
jgi:putative acetyltransferase